MKSFDGADQKQRPLPIGRILGGLVAVVLLISVGRQVGGRLPQFAEWVDGLGVWGPAVFVAGYAGATVAFVPGSVLTLAAGAIFGFVRGVAYVMIGATLGASLAFLVARYIARGAIEQRLEGNRRFAAIDRAVGREGRSPRSTVPSDAKAVRSSSFYDSRRSFRSTSSTTPSA